MSLELHYSAIDSNIIALLEKSGRRFGLSLDQMELLGQRVDTALGFVDAFEAGTAHEFIDNVDFYALEAELQPSVVC